MPNINVSMPHGMKKVEVIEKLRPIVNQVIDEFKGQDRHLTWTDEGGSFRFRSMGFAIKGNIHVHESEIKMDVELPFAAILYKTKAEKAMKKYIAEAFEVE